MTAQQRVWNVLEPWGSGSLAARRVGGFVGAVIMLAVVATIAESVRSIHEAYHAWFIAIEVFCLLVFGTEYALRLWAAGCEPRFQGLRGRLRWMVTFWAIIDLIAILPAILLFLDFDLRVVRAVRLIRLFRLGRYSRGLRVLVDTFRGSRRQLAVAFSGLLVLMLFASVAVYLAERDAQPDAFGSIPASMWWAICTLTTVGYGDVIPQTILGRVLASGIALMGVITVAVPAGIFAAGFERASRHKEEAVACPHCGKLLPSTSLSGPSMSDPMLEAPSIEQLPGASAPQPPPGGA